MNFRRLAIVIAVLVVLLVLSRRYDESGTPKWQPPLVSLTSSNLPDFSRAFDAASADTRVVLLVSPT